MSEPSSASSPQCESCGKVMLGELSAKICPACLFAGISLHPGKKTKPGEFQAPPPEDLELLFPEFRISRLVGRGGMGAVYQAHQIELERDVAIKILPPESATDPEFQERFRREAATLAQLDHPNIVSLYDFGEREGYFYFVMEYVDGMDLAERMSGDELPTEKILEIMGQVCDALEAAHAQGVIHRDIKPANIIIRTETGQVKIVDFGLAKVVRGDVVDPGLTRTQTSMGTPQYMAPEQMAGSKEVDHRSDIYAMGVVLYELLTGEVPGGNFKTPSEQNVDLNPRLDEVVMKAMRAEPEKRFQHASEVKTQLYEAASKPAISPRQQVRRLTAKMLVAVVLTSLLASFGVWWMANRNGGDAGNGPGRVVSGDVFQVVRFGTEAPMIPSLAEGVLDLSLSGSEEGFGVAIDRRGMVVAWGSNRYGQASPPSGLFAIKVVAGQGKRNAHALALRPDGTVVGWGDDTFGQASPPPGLGKVVAIAAGETFSLALKESGEVVSWGSLSVAGFGFSKITAGAKFAAGLRENGTIETWGSAPDVEGRYEDLAAGESHLLAKSSEGLVECWGLETPPELPMASGIFAGSRGAGLIDRSGLVRVWGKVPPELNQTKATAVKFGLDETMILMDSGD